MEWLINERRLMDQYLISKWKFAKYFEQTRLVSLADTYNEGEVESAEDKKRSEKEYKTMADLIRLEDKAKGVISKESNRHIGLGSLNAATKGHLLSFHLPSRIVREVEDTISKEHKTYQNAAGKLCEFTQRKLGFGTERVTNRLEANIESQSILTTERDKIIENLKKRHGIEAKMEGDKRIFEEEVDSETGKKRSTESIILNAGGNSYFQIHAKTIGAFARGKDYYDKLGHRLEGAHNLKRQVTALDKAINLLNKKIESGDRALESGKATETLKDLQQTLKERADISEEDFTKYAEEFRDKGKMNIELIKTLETKGMADLVKPLKRAFQKNIVGTLGAGKLRKIWGMERGNVFLRQQKIKSIKESAQKTTEKFNKGKEYANIIREKFLKGDIKENHILNLNIQKKYIASINKRRGKGSEITSDNLELIVNKIDRKTNKVTFKNSFDTFDETVKNFVSKGNLDPKYLKERDPQNGS